MRILAKQDEDLEWHDFQNILGPHLPAGTYEESVYFLPLAFDYVLLHDEHALELTTSLIGFCSRYAGHLRTDGAIDAVRERLMNFLMHCSATFRVGETQTEAGATFYYVLNSQTLVEALNELAEFSRHQDLAETFIRSVADLASGPQQSAWFLELARTHIAKGERRLSKRLASLTLFEDRELLQKHAVIVWDSPELDTESDYWQNLFQILNGRCF